MTSEFKQRLKTIDQTVLMPLVQRALEDPTITVIDWQIEPVEGGFGHSYGVYRVRGTAQATTQGIAWSLILKATGAVSSGSQTPASLDYWPREVLAYQSGLLDHLHGGLIAPRCLGIVEYPGEEFWIWLEDVVETEAVNWPLARYGLAARHLGQFNGAYLTGRPLPQAPWLLTDPLRQRLALAEPGMDSVRELSRDPLFEGLLPGDSVERALRLWGEREQWLARLDQLPQVLCHLDAFRRNLIARRGPADQPQTVAIDWDKIGLSAVGTEIVPLFATSLRFLEIDLTQLANLDALIFAGYLAGLRDAGWQGDAALVRFGYAATAALVHGVAQLGVTLPRVVAMAAAAAQRGEAPPQLLGSSRAQAAALKIHLLDLGDEARTLFEA